MNIDRKRKNLFSVKHTPKGQFLKKVYQTAIFMRAKNVNNIDQN